LREIILEKSLEGEKFKKTFGILSRSGSPVVLPSKQQNSQKREPRLNVFEKGQNAVKTLFGIGGYLKKSSIGVPLQELIHFRLSQINGCAYCLDMHYKDKTFSGLGWRNCSTKQTGESTQALGFGWTGMVRARW
jgi:alkylhydroperoxidase family enzyme